MILTCLAVVKKLWECKALHSFCGGSLAGSGQEQARQQLWRKLATGLFMSGCVSLT